MCLDLTKAKSLVMDALLGRVSSSRLEEIAEFFNSSGVSIPTIYGNRKNLDSDIWKHEHDRTTGRYFHGLLFMSGWSYYIAKTGNQTDSNRAFEIVTRWHDRFPLDASDNPEMSYHDETTAQRLNIALGLLAASDFKAEPNVFEFADETAELLRNNQFHSGLNNHGMFQDMALRNYAILADWADEEDRIRSWEISCRRLKNYFNHAFTHEGVHVENTPTYHLMVSRHLQEHIRILKATRSLEAIDLENLLEKAGRYATNIVLPNGEFPPISDTTIQKLRGNSGNIFDESFNYAVTMGENGTVPSVTNIVFQDSGYAIYRSDWKDENATFLLLQAAYNDNYHKHSDDLSIIIHAGGRALISEAGPYSYNYKDKFSRYAYSQFSHNNIVVNGISTPRTDKLSDTVRIVESRVDEFNFDVTASTGRLPGASHSRNVVVNGPKRNEVVRIVDTLDSDTNNNYDAHWHLPQNLEITIRADGFDAMDNDKIVLKCHIAANAAFSLKIQKASLTPRVTGWYFPKFNTKVPMNTIAVSFEAQKKVEMKTTFQIISDENNANDDSSDSTKDIPPKNSNLSSKVVQDLDEAGRSISILPPIGRLNIWFDDVSNRLFVSAAPMAGTQMAFRLYSREGAIDFKPYSDSNYASWAGLAAGPYRVRLFRKYKGEIESSKETSNWFSVR